MPDVSYVPGALTAVAGDQCWALVAASPASPVVTRIWQQLVHGDAGGTLLSGLLADGFDGIPGFALLTAGPAGQYRLFCRGVVGATIITGAAASELPPGDVSAREGQPASERVDGTGLLTWREHVAANAERIFLGEPPAQTALRLPATSGVLLATCVVIDLTDSATRQRPKKTIVFFPDTVTVPPPDGGAGNGPDPVVAAAPLIPLPEPPAPAPAAAAAGSAGGPDSDGEYDFFWGATQMRTVEDAAVRGSVSAPPGGLIDVPQWLAGPGDPGGHRQTWRPA